MPDCSRELRIKRNALSVSGGRTERAEKAGVSASGSSAEIPVNGPFDLDVQVKR